MNHTLSKLIRSNISRSQQPHTNTHTIMAYERSNTAAVSRFRFFIEPDSGFAELGLALEVAEGTNEVRLAPKYPTKGLNSADPDAALPPALARQLFMMPDHTRGDGIGPLYNVGAKRFLVHDKAAEVLRTTTAAFDGSADQVFDASPLFYSSWGELRLNARPGHLLLGSAEGELAVSVKLDKDNKPVKRPLVGGPAIYDVDFRKENVSFFSLRAWGRSSAFAPEP
ncbi:hypothetical protein DFJ73DRAFT_798497 [Zopfochytrium polystomum]|nr:hypothetical protein DFJ73DRAFT_798497 [Zopfochytrium polystomum]